MTKADMIDAICEENGFPKRELVRITETRWGVL